MRNGNVDASTDSGRATSSSTRPMPSAGRIEEASSGGVASSPSITNRPIWASQAIPSAKPRVAGRCGSRALPSTSRGEVDREEATRVTAAAAP